MENKKKEIAVYRGISLAKYSNENMNSIQVMNHIKGKDLIQVREGGSFILSSMTKEKGREASEKIILQFLIQLAIQLNLQNKVSDDALRAVAEDLYEMAYYINVEELGYFFRELRRGKYGSMYENLNSEKVCRAMDQFIVDRSYYFQRKSANKTKEMNKGGGSRTNQTTAFRDANREALARFKRDGVQDLREKNE